MKLLQYSPVIVAAVVICACGGSPHRAAFDSVVQTTHVATTFLAPVPGRINRHVVQSNIHKTVCIHGYTKKIRPPQWYTTKLKRQQMDLYNLPGNTWDYEEDHLIPLSLGGHPSSPQNLWPEPHPRSFEVDKIEFQLYLSICNNSMTLVNARHIISHIKHTEG
jgi:hypothetical protein